MPAPSWFLDVSRVGLWLGARALFRIRYQGVEHVPRSGPVLVTPNHVSYMDPVIVSIPIRRPLHYLTLEEFFHVPAFGPLIRWLRAFPVDNSGVDSRAMRRGIRILRAGEPLMIFPEGRRSVDGRPGRFVPGVFRLGLVAEVPVVPVTIAGGFEAWPIHRRLPRPHPVTITFHPAITGKDLPHTADRRTRSQLMADLVRRQIEEALPSAHR